MDEGANCEGGRGNQGILLPLTGQFAVGARNSSSPKPNVGFPKPNLGFWALTDFPARERQLFCALHWRRPGAGLGAGARRESRSLEGPRFGCPARFTLPQKLAARLSEHVDVQETPTSTHETFWLPAFTATRRYSPQLHRYSPLLCYSPARRSVFFPWGRRTTTSARLCAVVDSERARLSSSPGCGFDSRAG